MDGKPQTICFIPMRSQQTESYIDWYYINKIQNEIRKDQHDIIQYIETWKKRKNISACHCIIS